MTLHQEEMYFRVENERLVSSKFVNLSCSSGTITLVSDTMGNATKNRNDTISVTPPKVAKA
jgi:hypothetical protein